MYKNQLKNKLKMSLSESIISLRNMIDSAESEIKSLLGGRKASAARARKSLQDIKMSCHSLRKEITEYTQNLPIKSRVKKVVEPEPVVEPVVEAVVEQVVEPVKKVKKSRSKKVVE